MKWWIVTVRSKEYNGREKKVPIEAETLLDALRRLADDTKWTFYEPIRAEELQ